MSATTLSKPRVEFGAENLDEARQRLIFAMRNLDHPETRRAHKSAALAADLIDDALASLAGSGR